MSRTNKTRARSSSVKSHIAAFRLCAGNDYSYLKGFQRNDSFSIFLIEDFRGLLSYELCFSYREMEAGSTKIYPLLEKAKLTHFFDRWTILMASRQENLPGKSLKRKMQPMIQVFMQILNL